MEMGPAARLVLFLLRLRLPLLLLPPLLLGSLVGAQHQHRMRPNALLLRGNDSESRGSDQRQHQTRPPLLMMQLYRTMLTEDRELDQNRIRNAAAKVNHTLEESNPALHDSDAVISLVAKSESRDLIPFIFQLWGTGLCCSIP